MGLKRLCGAILKITFWSFVIAGMVFFGNWTLYKLVDYYVEPGFFDSEYGFYFANFMWGLGMSLVSVAWILNPGPSLVYHWPDWIAGSIFLIAGMTVFLVTLYFGPYI